jgi:hypothetical protein
VGCYQFSHATRTVRSASLQRAALEMHTDPEGRQALMMFGLDRMRRLGTTDLDTVEQLVKEYEDLLEHTAAATAR